MSTVLIKNICLTPELLTSEIRENIFKKLKENFEGKSFKDDGFITSIQPNFTLLDNFISASSAHQIICKIKFSATVVKPKIGDVFVGKVITIDERAIIITIHDHMMNVLISAMRMENCVFVKGENCFVQTLKDGTKLKISIGSQLKTEITAVKFDKKFICIGRLID